MDNFFESGLDSLSDEALKYVGVTNLDFRTHLSKDELLEVQNIMFSINTLIQITFKDGTFVSDIENVKHLLENSPMCDDRKIEKIILRRNTSDEVKQILMMPYDNPDTWNIAYDVHDDTYMITTLPNYRLMEEYIGVVLSCIKDDMSPLEKIKEVYDFVKLLELDEKASNRFPDIIKNRVTNNLGFNVLFSEILKRIGIKSYIGKIQREQMEYITIVSVKDEKYEADGIYAFDPVSDSIPKHAYKNDAMRKINYNFFALSLKKIVSTTSSDKLLEPLSLLTIDSLDFSERRVNVNERRKLEEIFDSNYEEIFKIVNKTKDIKDENLLNLFISTVHREDFINLNRDIEELIRNNYYLRKKDLFINLKKDDIEDMNIHDV